MKIEHARFKQISAQLVGFENDYLQYRPIIEVESR